MRLLILAGIALTVAAQQSAPQFEVASFKHDGDTVSNMRGHSPLRPLVITPGSVSGKTTLMQMLIGMYQLKPYQLQGPDWLDREVYQIDARMPDGTSRETAWMMVESLLSERLGMKVHRETKETSVFLLVAIPGSDKLEEVTPALELPQMIIGANGLEARPGSTLAVLATVLWQNTGRPVVDETGRNGYYKVKLRWSQDGGPPDLGAGMLSALPQIGLKVESAKRGIEYIIVDKISKEPTAN